MPELTHLDSDGKVAMVDVTSKSDTHRTAVAGGTVIVNARTHQAIRDGGLKKGDVLTTARIAGIMAAKRTSDLIPMCHPLQLTHIDITIEFEPTTIGDVAIHIKSSVTTTGKTGVEMEALTAVSVTALTIYDMAKSVQKNMRIENIRLIRKLGGKSGDLILESEITP
jgi:cyclic pyranopterin phosphate synthase